jgi:hypothetical protein
MSLQHFWGKKITPPALRAGNDSDVRRKHSEFFGKLTQKRILKGFIGILDATLDSLPDTARLASLTTQKPIAHLH